MKKYSIPFVLWSVLFVVLPLILVLITAFNGNVAMGLEGYSFSPEHFIRFFEPLYLRILLRSILLALVSTAVCLLVGYPVAYFLSQMDSKKSGIWILLFLIPMWMNFLLRTYAWITLLGRNGVLNRLFSFIGLGPFDMMYNQGAILMGMIYNFLPFMVLPIFTVLSKMDKSYLEAAKDLGATPRQVFTRVVLPLSLPGVSSGVLMCFIPALSTFVISSLLGGNKYYLIGNLIEQQFRFTGNWPFGSAISAVLMVIMFLSLFAIRKAGLEEVQGGENA
ncbi:MAG: ABC transporter permease [Tissierellia bacterium]|nr:ABC transporter permease [Tissierellia bacterium]